MGQFNAPALGLDGFVSAINDLRKRIDALERRDHASTRAGTETVSTTAAVFGSATVTHGLSTTPSSVVATAVSSNGVVNVTVYNVGDTTFDLFVRYTDDVSRTTSNDVYWLAFV